jgi:hypothetical protein
VNLGKPSCAPRRLSTAVEFTGSHIRSIDRKLSSMGIAGVEPRQLAPSMKTTESGCTDSLAPSSHRVVSSSTTHSNSSSTNSNWWRNLCRAAGDLCQRRPRDQLTRSAGLCFFDGVSAYRDSAQLSSYSDLLQYRQSDQDVSNLDTYQSEQLDWLLQRGGGKIKETCAKDRNLIRSRARSFVGNWKS